MLTNKTAIIGHRGAAGLAFENSITSILKGIELGADYIEIDVWKTADNELIVFHDAYLERLTPHTGFIKDINIKQLNSPQLNSGDAIPTLKEVIDLVKQRSIRLLVEIKAEDAAEPTRKLLKDNLDYDRYVIGSFYHQAIMDLKLKDGLLKTAIMFESAPVSLDDYLQKINPEYVVISIETYNKVLIDIVKAQNRKLLFYTVNILPELELALRCQPYGIITNFPDLMLEAIKGR